LIVREGGREEEEVETQAAEVVLANERVRVEEMGISGEVEISKEIFEENLGGLW